MPFKLVKKSKNKIKCVRDEDSKLEVRPEDLNLSDNLNEVNVFLLEENLKLQLSENKAPHLFDFLNDINEHKKCLIDDPDYEKAYQPYIINRILSFSRDCIFFVSEMNQRPNMPKVHQYKYLMNAIRKKRRYIKTHKAEANQEIEALKFLFKLSNREAKLYRDIIYNEFGEFPKHFIEQTKTIRDNKGLVKHDRK